MKTFQPTRSIGFGIVGGIVGSVVMGVFAIAAAATYQQTGGFTPLYHIASSVIEPAAMETSMQQAMNGDLWHLEAGPAVIGLGVHMVVGATWGAIFGVLAYFARLSRPAALVFGTAYGLVVMVAMAFTGLPIVASLFGGGPPIRDMASMVGWGTFAAEHAIYGFVLGIVWAFGVRLPAIEQPAVERRQRIRVR